MAQRTSNVSFSFVAENPVVIIITLYPHPHNYECSDFVLCYTALLFAL